MMKKTLTLGMAMLGAASIVAHANWQSQTTLEAGSRDGDAQARGQVLVPLHAIDGQRNFLAFLNPALYGDSGDTENFSLGMGWRQLLAEKWVLEGNAFYDRTHATSGFDYEQWGVGMQFYSDYLHGEFNYYLPEDTQNLVSEFSAQSEQRRVSEGSSSQVFCEEVYPESHSIYQDYYVLTTRRRVEEITRVRQFWENREAAMEGYNAKLGARLPLSRQRGISLGLTGGWESYENDFGGREEGYTAEAQLQLLPGLAFQSEYRDREGQWWHQVQVGIPLGGSLRDAFRFRQPSMREQLVTRPVSRNRHVQTVQSGLRENPDRRQVKTKVNEEVQRFISGRGRVELDRNINFVDGDAQVNGDGTYENPYNVIQDAVDDALLESQGGGQWKALVFPKANQAAYIENVTIDTPGSVEIISTYHYKVPTLCGGQFSFETERPIWRGGLFVTDGTQNPTIGVKGFHITEGYFGTSGIQGFNIRRMHIEDNLFTDIGRFGVNFDINSGNTLEQLIVRDNHFDGMGSLFTQFAGGVRLSSSGGAHFGEVLIQDNHIEDATSFGNVFGNGITIISQDTTMDVVEITGNKIRDIDNVANFSGQGISFVALGNSEVVTSDDFSQSRLFIADNFIEDVSGNGGLILAFNGAKIGRANNRAVVSGNTFQGWEASGFETFAWLNTEVFVQIERNVFNASNVSVAAINFRRIDNASILDNESSTAVGMENQINNIPPGNYNVYVSNAPFNPSGNLYYSVDGAPAQDVNPIVDDVQ